MSWISQLCVNKTNIADSEFDLRVGIVYWFQQLGQIAARIQSFLNVYLEQSEHTYAVGGSLGCIGKQEVLPS